MKPLRDSLRSLLGRANQEQPTVSRESANTGASPEPRVVRLNDADALVRTPFGWMLVPIEDPLLLRCMTNGGVLEPGTTRVLTALIREGDTVVDVGAHIGLLSVPAAQAVGETGRVIACEPLPRLRELLRRNVYINALGDRVAIEACACGEQSGLATIHIGQVLGHSSLVPLEEETTTLEVPVRSLDEIVASGQRIALIKIDAEGFELEVLAGMRRVCLENPQLAIIVEFGPSHLRRANIAVSEWIGAFTRVAPKVYEIDEMSGRCSPLRHSGLDEVVSMNLLFLRQPESCYPAVEFR